MADRLNEWGGMSANEVRAAGVLYAVNAFVLWPLGLALGVKVPSDDPWGDVYFMSLKEAELIVEGKMDLAKEPEGCHPSARFLKYAESRIAVMPSEMEQETARRRIKALYPGFGVSPVRTSDT